MSNLTDGQAREPLGLPRGSVRAAMSLAVVIAAAGIATYLMVSDPGSDVTKMFLGGWATALGNVIGFYFGTRTSDA